MTVKFLHFWYWQKTDTEARSYEAGKQYTAGDADEEAYFQLMIDKQQAQLIAGAQTSNV